MIKLDKLTISKAGNVIFRDLSYAFHYGKPYALMGSSGSGKSTLLNGIAGFEKFDSGNIYIHNKRLVTNHRFYKLQLGYLFQNYGLIDNLSVEKNINIRLAFKKNSKKIKRQIIVSLLKDLDMNIDLTRKVSTLSGGEQQRVALIRLLLKDPTIILADEPTGSVDKENGERILSKLLSTLNNKKVIIIATHDINIARKCDVILNIADLNTNST
ncbi:ATP-binding cassette domain-containing protein [Staphylococcus xylosus]